jgi:hypothetical protein
MADAVADAIDARSAMRDEASPDSTEAA